MRYRQYCNYSAFLYLLCKTTSVSCDRSNKKAISVPSGHGLDRPESGTIAEVLVRSSLLYVFNFLILISILSFQFIVPSRLIQKCLHHPVLSADCLHVPQPHSFPTNRSPKNAGKMHFGGFFHQIKVRRQIGRKDSIQAVCRRMRRLERFLY